MPAYMLVLSLRNDKRAHSMYSPPPDLSGGGCCPNCPSWGYLLALDISSRAFERLLTAYAIATTGMANALKEEDQLTIRYKTACCMVH